MTVRRLLAVVAFTVATVPFTGAPAAAHGAPTNPVSRAAACGPEGREAGTLACQAAIEAGAALREWDNVRVFGVDGRDRERIPDGELCSGGLSAYRGLDLPRTDWPVTELAAGARFTFRYRTTIPHKGTFRLYVTRAGYDPANRLTWADLESVPFLRVTDPPVRDGAYQLPGRLPADRTGRHLIYTVWQNSDTPDTYYSCSDVLFRPATAKPSASPAAASGGAAAAPRTAGAGPAGDEPAAPAAGDRGVPVASVTDLDGDSWPLVAGVAAVLTVLLAAVVGLRLRRAGSVPVGPPCEVRNHRVGRRRIW